MSHEVFVSHVPGETLLAVTDSGQLLDLVVVRDHEHSIRGNIYLGRVEKVVTGLNAAFIDIGQKSAGFLAAADGQIFDRDREKPQPITALYNEGDKVLVEVTREPSIGKGAKLTTRLSLSGRTVVLTPGRTGLAFAKSYKDKVARGELRAVLSDHADAPAGLIVRSRAQFASVEQVATEAANLVNQWAGIEAARSTEKPPARVYREEDDVFKYIRDHGEDSWQRIVVDDRQILERLKSFCRIMIPELVDRLELAQDPAAMLEIHDLDAQIEELLGPEVELSSGPRLHIEETAALVAIDVDSGAHQRERDPEAFALAINEAAAKEIGRQINLRNLSGQIVVDFLRLKRRENREKVQHILTDVLAESRADHNIFGFSRLGLLELTRQRIGESLTRRMMTHPMTSLSLQSVALKMFRRVVRELDRNPGKSLTVICGAELFAMVTGEMQPAWHSLLERTGPVVVLQNSDELPVSEFDLTTN